MQRLLLLGNVAFYNYHLAIKILVSIAIVSQQLPVKNHLFTMILAQFLQLSRVGMVQVPSIREYNMMGFKKKTYFGATLVLWNTISLEIHLSPIMNMFKRALKN